MEKLPYIEDISDFEENEDMLKCGNMVLAMAYVPVQSWVQVSSPEEALCRGTQFPDLDKPFFGEDVWR